VNLSGRQAFHALALVAIVCTVQHLARGQTDTMNSPGTRDASTRAAAQSPPVQAFAPGDHALTIRVGELDRHYTVHVPPAYDGRHAVPVVVMLHGGGGRSQGAAAETGWNAKADAVGCLAVYPNAMARDPAQPASFGRNPQLWNDGSARFYAADKAPDDVAFLNAMLDDVAAKFSVDARRVFLAGFSNGASMAFRFGAAASGRIAAVAPVAGTCWAQPLQVARPISLCYIAGTADALNPLEGGVPQLPGASAQVRGTPKPPVRVSIAKWASAVGCPALPTTTQEANGVRRETYGPGRNGAEVIFVTVEGLGHTWAGGKSLLPEFMVGKQSSKLQATDFLWDFFQKHPACDGKPQGRGAP